MANIVAGNGVGARHGETEIVLQDFSAITERIVRRAVDIGRLRADFRAGDFVLITRGVMANMTGAGDWRRHITLLLEGIRGPER